MKIALVGSGATAAITLLELLATPHDHQIRIVARNSERALAALMDAASAFPIAAQQAGVGSRQDVSQADLVIICAGAQMAVDEAPKAVLETNAAIVRDYLSEGVSPGAVIVLVGTPVDDLTAVLGSAGIVEKRRVIGFGGDLDTARLKYVLAGDGDPGAGDALCIGEHGSRTVPVYASERDYAGVAARVRGTIKAITAQAGPPRNLATGVWLSRLATNAAGRAGGESVVCGYMPELDLYLTWPRHISRDGLAPPSDMQLGPEASAALRALILRKREEHGALASLSARLFHVSP